MEDWENTYGFDSIDNTKDSLNLHASRKHPMPSSCRVATLTLSPLMKYMSISEIAVAQVSRCKCLLEAYYMSHVTILCLVKKVPRGRREAGHKAPAVGNLNSAISCSDYFAVGALIDKYRAQVATSEESNRTLKANGDVLAIYYLWRHESQSNIGGLGLNLFNCAAS